MSKITIMGKVHYKQVVTDTYKEKARAEIQGEIDKLAQELENFDEQMNKTITELTLKAHPQTEVLRQQFNVERDKIVLYKDQLQASLGAVDTLAMGSYVDAGEGNFVSELEVGQPFTSNLQCEVIVKDDVVVEIHGPENA